MAPNQPSTDHQAQPPSGIAQAAATAGGQTDGALLNTTQATATTTSTRAERHREMMRTAAEFLPAYALILAAAYYSTTYIDTILDAFPKSIFGDMRKHISCGKNVTQYDSTIIFWTPLVMYWTVALGYFFLDWYVYVNDQLPEWKHRFEKKTPQMVHRLYRRAIWMMFGIVMVVNPLALPLFVMPLVKLREDAMCNVEDLFPSPHHDWVGFFIKAGIILLGTDFIFYTMHRICHEVPVLYRNIHKHHHAFVDSMAISASACHPLEQVFVNLNAVTVPCVVVGVPFHWLSAWMCFSVLSTVCSHSGYAWGGKPLVSSRTHDAHHKYQLCDYGVNIFMDKLFKTEFKDRIGKSK